MILPATAVETPLGSYCGESSFTSQATMFVFCMTNIRASRSTGLEVDALGGAPGVYSARYAGGEGHDSEANMKKLLSELENNDNRKARFRTVIALIIDGKVTTFDGIVNGSITEGKRGGEGFGYDPIFMPEGYNKTFAELGLNIKNNISHRAKAVQKLADYLLKM